jgi:hypothetical protein
VLHVCFVESLPRCRSGKKQYRIKPNTCFALVYCTNLLSQSKQEGLVSLDFFLQLDQSIQQCFGSGRASRNIDIHRHNAVASPDNGIRIMIIATTVGARAHGENPTRFWHLIIDFSQSRSHLVGQRACNNHYIRLPRRGSKYHTESVHVIPGSCSVHHFHCTACQSKCHGPKRSLTSPIHQVIDTRNGILNVVFHWNSSSTSSHGRDIVKRSQLRQRAHQHYIMSNFKNLLVIKEHKIPTAEVLEDAPPAMARTAP